MITEALPIFKKESFHEHLNKNGVWKQEFVMTWREDEEIDAISEKHKTQASESTETCGNREGSWLESEMSQRDPGDSL